MRQIPTIDDVVDARARLAGQAVVTPLLESAALNARVKGRVLIKAENLQRTGSFKFRGAWNCISRLTAETARGGVVAYSSGNHAQGVAAAAALMKLPALIVMPVDTPEIKKANTRSYGAEVVTYDRVRENREEIAGRIATERGAVIVPPFEHPQIIAGQGTSGLELVEQAAERGAKLDAVLAPVSGGGLIAGISLAVKARSPGTQIHSVEPEGFDDHARSLASGKRERNAKASGSICDALLSPEPGELTFAVNQSRLGAGLVVSEAEVRRAMVFAFHHLKLVIEPGGAVGLAAVLSGKIATEGRTIALIASGGNVDPALFAEILIAKD
ncbi:threonine ammonia-lyase [Aestuariivirga sp. YIM B02566]|uniref:Threonine/serine dehydratase n=1 Tax=Taklimakanibacter albus TaxID=2800327 RepID=A0ACC5QY93_9HYPH|nr:threonine/serine dehydratase [Aestuariivirga sp. YIM B02566]MBK1865334.1 threonine/serine dehydratase [Aestuariivirga sp. YIM B02566]